MCPFGVHLSWLVDAEQERTGRGETLGTTQGGLHTYSLYLNLALEHMLTCLSLGYYLKALVNI